MRKHRHLTFVVASIFLASLWGCGSSLDSGGDQTGQGTAISDAQQVGSSSCKICHTAILAQGWTGSEHDRGDADCEGCHGGGQFHKGIGPIPYPSPGPAQCTVCHSLTSASAISDTHNDNAATATTIEGYVVKTADQGGCKACHYNDHDPVLTINQEWSNSAHGGFIATGAVTEATAPAWVHYDWDNGTGTSADRKSCQRCHTATGISNFLTNPTTYNAVNNDFSHLSGWTSTNKTSGQNEMLYCWGCHSDVSTGTLRNPGAINEIYAAVNQAVSTTNTVADTGTTVTVSYPNIGASNVCMGCHLGREVGANITAVASSDGILSFVNSHYLTAGSTIFNKSGYEYAGQTYSTYGFHKKLGVGDPAANFNTGSDGPCVACHMSVDSGHTFVFLVKAEDGTIEENKSPVCSNCHANMDPGTLTTARETFKVALEELKTALDARGIFFASTNPYFFKDSGFGGGIAGNGVLEAGEIHRDNAFTNWQSVATAIETANPAAAPVDWRNVMGAAFNFNLFEHDPGAYAHNRDYALKLIADSIDFLADGTIDGDPSTAGTLIGQGINLDSGAGYSPIHDIPVAAAILDPQGSEGTCSACHPKPPHYGGGVGKPQWVNSTVTTCSVCHANNDPSTNGLIISQYAHSGHGDVTGIWTHDEAGSNSTNPASNPSNCQRCHTTSGYIASVGNAVYTFPVAPSAARFQVLNCNACHPTIGDGTATFQPVGAFSVTWSANSVSQLMTFPDASASNLCIRCHSGRRGGPQITNSYTYAHYLPAAAGLYGHYDNAGLGIDNASGIGFEFVGKTGAGIFSDINPHTTAGIADLNGTGNNGPCAACHMSGTAGHTWQPLVKDHLTGAISAINSGACVLCHDGTSAFALDVSNLQQIYDQYNAARNVLKLQLEGLGLYYNADNHSYYREAALTTYVMGGQTAADYAYVDGIITANPSLVGPVGMTRQYLLGAAYNYGFLSTEAFDAANYVHNPTYAKRLLFDSIDFLDNGVLDGTIVVTGDAAVYLDGDTGTAGIQRP